MWLINPHGRRVNVPSPFAEYYVSQQGWERADKKGEPEPKKPDVSYPIHVGGGNYELSDGSRVRGKANAIEAQSQL